LINTQSTEQAMSAAVGGDFESVGQLEYALLLQNGLRKDHIVIDVGCGSGRLAFQLREYLKSIYIGLDVVEDLFKYAEKICKRPDWKFYMAPGLSIPEKDDYADFICLFSVFTHLLHEESYKYLKDASRVLKPNGKIVISFLEFKIPSHFDIFEQSLMDNHPDKVLTQFISRDAIESWATHCGLEVTGIFDGDKPYIKLNSTIKFDNGCEMVGEGTLGQSVCVLTKR
jgi:ubiquinone/menaquinone biosynthesis C-methylase UbiE